MGVYLGRAGQSVVRLADDGRGARSPSRETGAVETRLAGGADSAVRVVNDAAESAGKLFVSRNCGGG